MLSIFYHLREVIFSILSGAREKLERNLKFCKKLSLIQFKKEKHDARFIDFLTHFWLIDDFLRKILFFHFFQCHDLSYLKFSVMILFESSIIVAVVTEAM